MGEDTINDLKRFIAATVFQKTSVIREGINKLSDKIDEFDARLGAKVDKVDKDIEYLSKSVARAMDTTNDDNDKRTKNHETRITHLLYKVGVA